MNTPLICSKREANEPIIEIVWPNGTVKTLYRERRPSLSAIRRLISELKKEPKLLLNRIDEWVLDQAFALCSAIAYCDGHNHIVAFVALWPSKNDNWLELGTLYVLPDYRGTGVAKVMFELCDDLVPQISEFLLTADPAIVAIAIKRGWRLEGNNWNGSGTFPWNAIIGPLWERYPKSPLKEPGLLLYRKARQKKVTLLHSRRCYAKDYSHKNRS